MMADNDYSLALLMATLPTELQLHIWNQLPNLWSVVALRLTNRTYNDFYKTHGEVIRRSQRDRLINTITHWYDVALRPHGHEMQYAEATLDRTSTGWDIAKMNETRMSFMTELHWENTPAGWNVAKQKTPFASEVKDFLPYGNAYRTTVCIGPGVRIRNWRPRRMPQMARHAVEWLYDDKLNTRHCVVLTGGRPFMLDTMHARIYFSQEHSNKLFLHTWDLQTFVRLQLEWVQSHPYLLGQGPKEGRVEVDSLEESTVSPREVQALRSALASSAWPDHLDQATISFVVAWWLRNEASYNSNSVFGDHQPPDTYLTWLLAKADKLKGYHLKTSDELRASAGKFDYLNLPYLGMHGRDGLLQGAAHQEMSVAVDAAS